MPPPADEDTDNVVSLHGSYRASYGRDRVPIRDMADAVRSFDQFERYAVSLQSGPLSLADEVDAVEWPIVSLQVQLPVIQRCLDHLGRFGIGTWPDTGWVLRLGDARATAVRRLQAVTQSLYNSPPGVGSLDG